MTDPINTALKAAIANKATGLINKKLGELWERYMTPIFEEMDFSGDREKVKLQYLQYCESLSKFKPLLTTSIVDIDDIYVPLTLKEIGGSSIKFQIDDQAFKQFDKSHNLISGVAGMGKSTALKKILLNTLSEGRFFPIFDELKHYDGGDIYANLARHWERLGITFTNKQIQSMLLSNGTVLFLDAFDEANPKFQEELAEQIQKISISTKCRLICTTRPSTAIFNNNYMREFEIERPSFAQAKEIIRKNSQDEEKAQGLISKLASSTLFKKSNENVMVSPILIILYCASYNLGSDIPDTLHKFYEEIFEVVFLKHDNFKMKVEREYVFNDNKGIYRDLFDHLSYFTQKDNKTEISSHEFSKYLESGLQHIGRLDENKKDIDKIRSNIVDISNLIIKDGYEKYRFIHKSIQEYYSASFIKSIPEKSEKFYASCLNMQQTNNLFENSLRFLEAIDERNYFKYYIVKGVEDLLGGAHSSIGDGEKIYQAIKTNLGKVIYLVAEVTVFRDPKTKQTSQEKTLVVLKKHKAVQTKTFENQIIDRFAALLSKQVNSSENLRESIVREVISESFQLLMGENSLSPSRSSGSPKEGHYEVSLENMLNNKVFAKNIDCQNLISSTGYPTLFEAKYRYAIRRLEDLEISATAAVTFP